MVNWIFDVLFAICHSANTQVRKFTWNMDDFLNAYYFLLSLKLMAISTKNTATKADSLAI